MREESRKFLHKLLTTPSPTGHEQKIQRVVINRMQQYADYIETCLLYTSPSPRDLAVSRMPSSA